MKLFNILLVKFANIKREHLKDTNVANTQTRK